ncbi:NAD(P)H-hydrate dehydratase [Candidatus Pyrohabitans sp.]
MRMLTAEELRILDINSAWLGVPTEELMENAGRAVAEEVAERVEVEGKRVLVLCGTGNNGGDGLVAARYLAQMGASVMAMLLGEPRSSASKQKLSELRRLGIRIKQLKKQRLSADIIVDALLGTGIKGAVREPYRSVIEEVNKSAALKVSVDLPSGLNEVGEGYCVAADLVVTFHAPKPGLERFPTIVVDIGIPEKASRYVGPGDVVVNLPERRKEAHKGDHGRVLIIGGSMEYHGAPLLSALGALNAGVDLVYLAVPEVNFEVSRSFSPELIVRAYPGEYLSIEAVATIEDLLERATCVLLGPGLGVRKETARAVLEILRRCSKPCVVDADALKALKGELPIKGAELVLTPHAGEFNVLTGEHLPQKLEERSEVVRRWSRQLESVILLKGSVDIVASPEGRVKFNETGNPGMTVGGTGDVLSGLTAGLIAQGMGVYQAACCSAFINGYAGDMLLEEKGYAFTASNLAAQVPHAVKRIFDFL